MNVRSYQFVAIDSTDVCKIHATSPSCMHIMMGLSIHDSRQTEEALLKGVDGAPVRTSNDWSCDYQCGFFYCSPEGLESDRLKLLAINGCE